MHGTNQKILELAVGLTILERIRRYKEDVLWYNHNNVLRIILPPTAINNKGHYCLKNIKNRFYDFTNLCNSFFNWFL